MIEKSDVVFYLRRGDEWVEIERVKGELNESVEEWDVSLGRKIFMGPSYNDAPIWWGPN